MDKHAASAAPSAAAEQTNGNRYSRGDFLKRVGLGAGAVAAGGGLRGVLAAPPAMAARSSTVTTAPTTFGRMFPHLPPFADATDGLRASLNDMGKAGGLLDARDALAAGPARLIYRPRFGHAFIPVEFQGSCYRFGHSIVRPSYRANLKGDGGNAFFGMIFDPAGEGAADPVDLRGGARAARRFIGWQTFFDFGDGEVKPNKLIDTKISTPLFNLPLGAIASHDQPQVLPQRTLLRHLTWSLPSGQAVAAAIGAPRLSEDDLKELQPYGFQRSAPLWYYTLKEAELMENGLRLGPLGGRIVAEVLIGLLQADPHSYVNAKQKWQPTF